MQPRLLAICERQLAPGVSASNAALRLSGPTVAVGGISAAYGGSGEQLEYSETAFLQWDRAAPGKLVLDLLDAGVDAPVLRA